MHFARTGIDLAEFLPAQCPAAGRFADRLDPHLVRPPGRVTAIERNMSTNLEGAMWPIERPNADHVEQQWSGLSPRAAFITPEFVTEYADGGGLGSYLYRTARSLVEFGWKPEVFVTSKHASSTLEMDGILVHRVGPTLTDRVGWRLDRRVGLGGLDWAIESLRVLHWAYALKRALARRELLVKFAFVQSADHFASGLFVRQGVLRPHVVRCSSAPDLYAEVDLEVTTTANLRRRMELASIRRADLSYAPSQLVASHLSVVTGRRLEVIRPPALADTGPRKSPPSGLPAKYLLHFGQLKRRKGTDWLVAALPSAFVAMPDMRIVIMGPGTQDDLQKWRAHLLPWSNQVAWLQPQSREVVRSIVANATAVVQPSLIDNLPNTVIESLLEGVPVIGGAGGSIDEMVVPGLTGELVPMGDVAALSSALIAAWSVPSSIARGFDWFSTGVGKDFSPERAIGALLQLVESWHSTQREVNLSRQGRGE